MVLPDVIRPGLRVVFCGSAAGTASARRGAYYAGPGNSFWATLHTTGLTPRRFEPPEFARLVEHGIGLTDLNKVASGSDLAIGTAGDDVARLHALIEENAPTVLAFNGMRGARRALPSVAGYGRQAERFAGAEVWVLPSTSGAARGYWDVAPWTALAQRVA